MHSLTILTFIACLFASPVPSRGVQSVSMGGSKGMGGSGAAEAPSALNESVNVAVFKMGTDPAAITTAPQDEFGAEYSKRKRGIN
ncbi:hypothetical protein CONCODRAFT_5988 [Conidiobolus coronatus NRRL 28638]|uniref:Uncharacterized protein n=1 Tax=Conidiobolus coronatus (strain ATCC 28846 / CBS 209.66 / NRRL 28638) TaxID=796925 RepID=A0A137P8L4_CONC2|nr:hypothetical protein CONCODRAFT_5988 [Conidiobolus coronatus NRRL 28638]|eukprot:KXN71348.1 hypothetical protein CONCODRAFT_5988 [Conidiobolus coronatus NRRL 28638]